MEKRPLRILHVVGGMSRGGVETWLRHVLRNIDRDRFQMDFLVHTDKACAYDDEIRALGSRILPCLSPSRPLKYAREFRRILAEYGPYDVIHSHVHHYSGYVLRLAHSAGVPLRIAHSHNDTSALEAGAGLRRRVYLSVTGRWIARYAMAGLSASRLAAVALFGSNWESDPRWQSLYCGVDFSHFRQPADQTNLRAELGLPPDAFVVGHVGRFSEQKNHKFLIEIAAEIARREPNMRLLLIGDGTLRPEIEDIVNRSGLTEKVVFAGLRADVHRLMLEAMDVFLFPSLHEGLPLVGMEVQAAGVPSVMSDTITSEVEVVSELVQWLSLSQPASVWAEAVLSAREMRRKITQPEALAKMEQSPFNVQVSIRELERVYAGATQ
jgi:glycosyltransferase involved in cell wall biosynthesis